MDAKSRREGVATSWNVTLLQAAPALLKMHVLRVSGFAARAQGLRSSLHDERGYRREEVLMAPGMWLHFFPTCEYLLPGKFWKEPGHTECELLTITHMPAAVPLEPSEP